MITIHTYKLQGNGSDSWHVDIHNCETEAQATRENRVSREIVFTDPTKPEVVPMNNFDLSTMTEEQLTELKNILGL